MNNYIIYTRIKKTENGHCVCFGNAHNTFYLNHEGSYEECKEIAQKLKLTLALYKFNNNKLHIKDEDINNLNKNIQKRQIEMINFICDEAGVSQQLIFSKTRKQPIPFVRTIIAASFYHFFGIPFSQTEKSMPVSRSTLYILSRKLQTYFLSNSKYEINIIQKISHQYNDDSFIERCKSGAF